ncbi:unconventional myosin-VIIa-like isoform X3 [Scyliorhinus canicula]|uniref:unconventional myosin-VIIa-like isoform X3 n=1 Tax=Scyliorhinus canicula TaxID=7830 RepID=UPI0018F42551|nr:unconventional myosin-VIIa-like isoform X3 [Scyliorhinus canicula]
MNPMEWAEGNHVWYEANTSGEFNAPIGAVIRQVVSGKVLLLDDEGKEQWIDASNINSVHPMHPTSVKGVDDMIRIGDLNEAGILHNLLIRFRENIIYTYTGSILVAVNPYQLLPLYTTELINLYTKRRIGDLPPHIFAIADNCYFNLRKNREDQCCIISGESGAGKTESTKLLLQFLAAVSGQHMWIEQQILEATPILEAFGNAKTVKNDNSSRFGKYIEIYFNDDGIMQGAKIEQYLLEKSRVCGQAQDERNYHIFYSMLMGMSTEKKKLLSLGTAHEYDFLTKGNCTSCDGHDDVKHYADICSAMKILMFADSEQWDVNKLLASILHLGNLHFQAAMYDNLDCCELMESSHLSMATKLLEVNSLELENAMTHRSILIRGESVTTPVSKAQAAGSRDALVKGIYDHLFVWIVNKINTVINTLATNYPGNICSSIGLLDIFGFENFNSNSFEQLCINLANEHLQQFFVRCIFKQEQAEYVQENIAWQHIEFTDNQKTLDALTVKPMNIISLIDEESKFPKGTDTTFLNKLNDHHGKNMIYVPPVSSHGTMFGILHFAGVVYYESKGFLDKNRDHLSSSIIQVVQSSKNKFLKQIFQTSFGSASGKPQIQRQSLRKGSITTTDSHRLHPTISRQFKQSLDNLMKTLKACQPYFIRCIKPNEFKKPLIFDRELCIKQLRYSGMRETIRIRKSGYPIRFTFLDFVQQYKLVLSSALWQIKQENVHLCCKQIAESVIGTNGDWKIGRTKIFLKENDHLALELERDRILTAKALMIQKVMRGFKDRKNFLRQKNAACMIQSHWRGSQCRKKYQLCRHGLLRLQALYHSRKIAKEYEETRRRMILFQALCRGYLIRQNQSKRLEALTIIQAYTRGMLIRKSYRKKKRDIQRRVEAQKIRFAEDDVQAKPEADEKKRDHLTRMAKMDMENERRQREEYFKTQQEPQIECLDELDMVDNIFAFLPTVLAGQEDHGPRGFEDLEVKQEKLEEFDLDDTSLSSGSDEEDDLAQYTFPKYAATYFQGSSTHTHIQRALRHPLLFHEDDVDILASLAIWNIILRFMGDLQEPRTFAQASERHNKSLGKMSKVRLATDQAGNEGPNHGRNSKRLNNKLSSKLNVPQNPSLGEERLLGENSITDRPMSNLEKLHFIIGNGIARPNIRDEIYCQICKQLSECYSKNVYARGWILMSLCVGCFPPTDGFMKYLHNFIRNGPLGYAPYCAERLRRTFANGSRREPPSYLELEATKLKQPIKVMVTLMSGLSCSASIDSATTANELCKSLAGKIGLKDTFGFSIYIALYDIFSSLGSGRDHVLDAISRCEQYVKRQGGQERHAAWRLFFRKEIFTPWHDCSEDPISTDLIYQQIIRGIRFGEYQCEKEEELVDVAAKYYYVRFGADVETEKGVMVVHACISDKLLKSKSPEKWCQQITAQVKDLFVSERPNALKFKEQLVDSARMKWPLLFSRFFEASKFSGPTLPKNQLVVAVNWLGISFVDKNEKLLLKRSFPEITGVNTNRASKLYGQSVTVTTLQGETYTLTSGYAEDIADLIVMFLNGLKMRSEYAVTLHSNSKQDDPIFLKYEKGDLIKLIKNEEITQDYGWIQGQNERTTKIGSLSLESVYIIPTLVKPPSEVMTLILMSPDQRRQASQNAQVKEPEVKIKAYTLEEFSYDHFRPPAKESMRKVVLPKAHVKDRIWACSKEPLRQPLLKRVSASTEMVVVACQAFTAIMRYMGDYPGKLAKSGTELTDLIFSAALQEDTLQDEIYCQIVKQLTDNCNRYSVDNGWQLLWLCTGLFPPSNALLPHVKRFLETHPGERLAADCIQRLNKVKRCGSRKNPPHLLEVEAIQLWSTKILHKIYFPNDTDEAFEIFTSTKAKDLCESITTRLKLSSSEGLSLFLQVEDKIISFPEGDFFFDYVRHVTDWVKKEKPTKDGTSISVAYKVLFMRKLWLNVFPGRDLKADILFHYPQELPKYLRGYHQCTKEDAIQIAAFLYKVKFNDDKSQFLHIPKMLKDLVPEDMIRMMSPEEWRKSIVAICNRHTGKTPDEVKLGFLKLLYRWATFGSAFFEVKQTSEPNFPDIVRIAINKQGVTVINPRTKVALVTHPYNKISNWCSGSTYFHMSVGSLVRGGKILCETSLSVK